MNCSQARRAILTDPTHLDDAVLAHANGCPTCQPLLRSQVHQQALIAGTVAMQAAPDLQPIMPPRRSSAPNDPTWASRRGFFAAAASVAFGATGALGLSMWWPRQEGAAGAASWVEAMTQHVRQDPIHLLPPDPAAPAHLQALLYELGARQRAPLPNVLHSGMCELLDCQAAHVVLAWRGQRVIAFLVPRPSAGVTPLHIDGWMGELRPVVGGMVATLAQDAAVAQAAGQALAAAVQWPTSDIAKAASLSSTPRGSISRT